MLRRTIFLFVILFISFSGFSQEKDTYQADSVMKLNRVKTKIRYHENSGSQAKEIYNFDQQGKLIQFALTSNANEKVNQFTISYYYNEKGQLVKEINRSAGDPLSKAEIKEYTYSPNGNYTAIEYVGNKKNIISTTTFEADSAKETHKLMVKGKLWRENVSYYENALYTYRFKGYEVTDGQPKVLVIAGKEFKIISEDNWKYDFENRYDKAGRLVERIRKDKGEIKDKSLYTYSPDGLLLEKIEINYHNGKETSSKELFSYAKW